MKKLDNCVGIPLFSLGMNFSWRIQKKKNSQKGIDFCLYDIIEAFIHFTYCRSLPCYIINPSISVSFRYDDCLLMLCHICTSMSYILARRLLVN